MPRPGILLPLTHLYKQYPNAVTAICPSDHFVLEEDLFKSHVDRAFRAIESDSARIVLLGVEARKPDPELRNRPWVDRLPADR